TTAGSLTTLYSFPANTSPTQSSTPWTVLQGKDGSLYGTTQYGGIVNNQFSGTIFKYSPDGSLTTIYAHQNLPLDALIQGSDGNFYGMALAEGQPGQFGEVLYQVTPDGIFTVVHLFTCSCEYPPTSNGVLLEGAPLTFYGNYTDAMDGSVVF